MMFVRHSNEEHKASGGNSCGRVVNIVVAGVLLFAGLSAAIIFLIRDTRKGKHIQTVEEYFRSAIDSSSVEINEDFIVEEVCDAEGAPANKIKRLKLFLEENDFNNKYSGIGWFSVKESHKKWMALALGIDGTDYDLTNPLVNTQVAVLMLKGLVKAGYTWDQAILFYVYGPRAVTVEGMKTSESSYLLAFVASGE